jgi:hypothetical protein
MIVVCLYADGVNISGGRTRVTQKDSEALVIASKENNIEANAEKN